MHLLEDLGISDVTYSFINLKTDEEKKVIANQVRISLEKDIETIIESLLDKEGKRNDKRTLEHYNSFYGKDMKLLSFRVLDELLIKEQKTSRISDFTKILTKDIFLKSVLMCATECIFFIGNVRLLQANDILDVINLKAFDFWRILNSFLKFDP